MCKVVVMHHVYYNKQLQLISYLSSSLDWPNAKNKESLYLLQNHLHMLFQACTIPDSTQNATSRKGYFSN